MKLGTATKRPEQVIGVHFFNPVPVLRLVELVPPFNGRQRMTLTPPVVNGARARLVLATGPAKQPVITRWIEGDRSLPIATVRRTATTVYLDRAAAPLE